MKVKIVLFLAASLVGCQSQPTIYSEQLERLENNKVEEKKLAVVPLNLKELPDTIRNEQEIRIKRLEFLSHKFGSQSPDLNEVLQIEPGNVSGVNYPIPVIKIRYAERTFFDSNKADIRPESEQILDVMAEQMNGDLPDTSLVILGHTDSVGTDEDNTKLSIQRASVVMRELAKRGVNTEQMSTLGIGEAQPIATNANEKGRALNRRVEFLLSRYAEANYIAIEKFPRNIEWLNNNTTGQMRLIDTQKKSLEVLKLSDEVIPTSNYKKTLHTSKNKKQIIKPEVVNTVLVPLKKSTRIVTLIPAEKFVVELLPVN